MTLHPGMSDADYFAHPAINHSILKLYAEHPPAFVRWVLDHPDDLAPTADMEFGSAVHALVLGGPDVVPVDADDWRTKAAKEAGDEARAEGRIPLLRDRFAEAHSMVAALREHALADKLISNADDLETVAVWDDDGTDCKAKLDGRTGRLGWDLKTTGNANPDAFGRSAAKYGYASQAAWYLEALRRCWDIDTPGFLFLVVEKRPPFLVNVIELDPYDVELGAKRNARALQIHRECVASGRWPGYDGIQSAKLPRYWEIEEETA